MGYRKDLRNPLKHEKSYSFKKWNPLRDALKHASHDLLENGFHKMLPMVIEFMNCGRTMLYLF